MSSFCVIYWKKGWAKQIYTVHWAFNNLIKEGVINPKIEINFFKWLTVWKHRQNSRYNLSWNRAVSKMIKIPINVNNSAIWAVFPKYLTKPIWPFDILSSGTIKCNYTKLQNVIKMGDSRKYPYHTSDSFHILYPPTFRISKMRYPTMPSDFHNCKPPTPIRIFHFFVKPFGITCRVH